MFGLVWSHPDIFALHVFSTESTNPEVNECTYVSLEVSKGVLRTTIPAKGVQVIVTGNGESRLMVESSSLEALNELLADVSYQHYLPHTHRRPRLRTMKLCFPLPSNSLNLQSYINSQVTITTKTFLRYPELKVLLRSIREFYKDIEIIIADDSMEPEKIPGPHIQQFIMPPAQEPGVSQVTTKYFLWVDDDFLFTKLTKIEELVKVMEANPELDVLGGKVQGDQFYFSLIYEEGDEVEGGCMYRKSRGRFHSLPGYPQCSVVNGVVNFFLARTDAVQRVGFDPQLKRLAHSEFFMDGLGSLMVATCGHVSVSHQARLKHKDTKLYQAFRNPPKSDCLHNTLEETSEQNGCSLRALRAAVCSHQTHRHPKGKRLFTFELPEEASSCLISRSVGEEKLVLWNTSDLWPQNSSVPEDLKQRLVSMADTYSYKIQNLTHSDSGLYQEECWTEGKVTHEKHFTVTVCGSIDRTRYEYMEDEETEDLLCSGAADHLDVQWLKRDYRSQQETWTRVFGDNTSSVMDNDRGRYQVVKNTSALRISNFSTTDLRDYNCLLMNQQQCVSSETVKYKLDIEYIYLSVEDTAVLQCPVTDFSEDKPPYWETDLFNNHQEQHNHSVGVVDQNYSLVLTSGMLNHSDMYWWCAPNPPPPPPAVELFSEGEEVTLRCKDWEKGQVHIWFFKSNRTKGRTFNAFHNQISGIVDRDTDGRLVISDVSLQDTGEYWCAVDDEYDQCMFSSKTVLKHRDPFGVHSTFYAVRCSALSVLLLMLCVAVVTVT
ncbi:hypothetical protein F7725_004089 [Dissostichus mawsoni]|uniref:Ig-like domain-containing protein n=1 Tax=Dissostichus mawsoni TaxID=36200 RepID=A0A7J5YDD5_DISMA|nr:hypothetical protein F7725_004089 [Dissostichus mawsoni]